MEDNFGGPTFIVAPSFLQARTQNSTGSSPTQLSAILSVTNNNIRATQRHTQLYTLSLSPGQRTNQVFLLLENFVTTSLTEKHSQGPMLLRLSPTLL